MAIKNAVNSSNEVFLGNEYIEIGINANGYFGTTGANPAGFTGRATGSGIGMVGDADGFGVGKDLNIDYFLPGAPEERWSISYDTGTPGYYSQGGAGSNSTPAATALPNYSLTDTSTATDASATFSVQLDLDSDSNSDLELTQVITVRDGVKGFEVSVTIENIGTNSIDDIVFNRSFDPDNTVDRGGSFETVNEIISQYGDSGSTESKVTATSQGNESSQYFTDAEEQAVIGYSSSSDTSSVYYGGFANVDPAVRASWSNYSTTVGDTITADKAIGIIFDIGTLEAGDSKTFSYKTFLGGVS